MKSNKCPDHYCGLNLPVLNSFHIRSALPIFVYLPIHNMALPTMGEDVFAILCVHGLFEFSCGECSSHGRTYVAVSRRVKVSILHHQDTFHLFVADLCASRLYRSLLFPILKDIPSSEGMHTINFASLVRMCTYNRMSYLDVSRCLRDLLCSSPCRTSSYTGLSSTNEMIHVVLATHCEKINGEYIRTMEQARTHWCSFRSELENQEYGLPVFHASGRFCRVWKAERHGLWLALKIVDTRRESQALASMKSTVHPADEPSLMRRLQHNNLVQCFAWFESPGSLLLILPYLAGGTLTDNVNMDGPYCHVDGARIGAAILSGVHYLHDSLITHRDLKTDNIMLTSVNRAYAVPQISDFGYARTCAYGCRCYTVCGTPSYMAPEIWALTLPSATFLQGYSFPVDVWSLGVVMYGMFAGYLPFDDDTRSIREQVLQNNVCYDEIDWEHMPSMHALVKAMLSTSSSARISAVHAHQRLLVESALLKSSLRDDVFGVHACTPKRM